MAIAPTSVLVIWERFIPFLTSGVCGEMPPVQPAASGGSGGEGVLALSLSLHLLVLFSQGGFEVLIGAQSVVSKYYVALTLPLKLGGSRQ